MAGSEPDLRSRALRTDDLDFPLPERLVAAEPAAERSASRLLAVECGSGKQTHASFASFGEFLQPGDLLVLNDTRVVKARLLAHKDSGGRVEGLFLEEAGHGRALCMISGSRLRPGTELQLDRGGARLRLFDKLAPGRWLVEDVDAAGWPQLLEQAGAVPLPPYIRRRRGETGLEDELAEDAARYQTVWAEAAGAVAAPTASLHFDVAMLGRLVAAGVEIAKLTLHVGAGTFQPVETEEVGAHEMHAERFSVPPTTLAALRQARADGRRIVAAGTTVCRVLEHLGAADALGSSTDEPLTGETDIFLLPGHAFALTDALLTNFHTPRSTLLALVAAFAQHCGAADGLAFVKEVYAGAVEREYRFYSYGDATFWMP